MSDDQIDRMASQFTTLEEQRAYGQAQFATINSQSKQINKLKNEVEELKKLLLNSVPKDPSQVSNLLIVADSDEEFIARVQIAELKRVCSEREFTLDEAKRLDIFVKILIALKGKAEKSESKKEPELTNEQLMEMMKEI